MMVLLAKNVEENFSRKKSKPKGLDAATLLLSVTSDFKRDLDEIKKVRWRKKNGTRAENAETEKC